MGLIRPTPLAALVRAWSGTALRHIPSGSSRDVLDDTHIGRASNNRWNRGGTPTYYFASDVAVAIAEYARHIATELPRGVRERQARSLFSVEINLDRTLDLRDPTTIAAMGASPIETWITDLAITRPTADYLRAHTDVQALLVPSVPFPDRPDRFNVVVYRDQIAPDAVFGTPIHVLEIVLEAVGE